MKNVDLLRSEMQAYGIYKNADGYLIEIGDEVNTAQTLAKCIQIVQAGSKELTEHIWESWKTLGDTSFKIASQVGQNVPSLGNILFLSNAKKAFDLSRIFTDLEPLSDDLLRLLDSDIAQADGYLINHFNSEFMHIQCLHKLIISECYRIKLLQQFQIMTKQAQISGPWANLDLPMKERVWPWDEGEDQYFEDRKSQRRAQTRYNPENATKSGFYYVWQDYTRDPYKFEDMKTDSPYKSRHQLLIA